MRTLLYLLIYIYYITRDIFVNIGTKYFTLSLTLYICDVIVVVQKVINHNTKIQIKKKPASKK